MTVKEFIAKLETFTNQDSELILFTTDGVQENIVVDVQTIDPNTAVIYYEEV
jgi:hypothetical protein